MNNDAARACSRTLLAFQAPLWLLLLIGFVSGRQSFTLAAMSLGMAMLIVATPFLVALQLDIRKLRRQLEEELQRARVGK